jgi:RsiW-degrading membrane proteinase PrsW (M82 family)
MTMRRWWAVIVGAMALGAIAWGIFDPARTNELMIVGSLLPAAVALAIWAEIGGDSIPIRAIVGGTIVGIVVAAVSHGVVLAFGYAFFLGFADRLSDFLDAISVDPRITEILESPWTIFLMAELVVVAPLTEELGKAIGARWARPNSRAAAFTAGAMAGAGFAVAENLLYASGAWWFGQSWTAVLLGRALGASVHVLASGLVVLGWWEWRNTGDRGRLWRGFAAGAGVHALWNGSLVVIAIADGAFELADSSLGFAAVSLSYSAAIGAICAAVLWSKTRRLAGRAEERDGLLRLGRAEGAAAWLILAASLLVPVAMLVITFPTIYG